MDKEAVQRIKVTMESKHVKLSTGAGRIKVEPSEADLSRQAKLPRQAKVVLGYTFTGWTYILSLSLVYD